MSLHLCLVSDQLPANLIPALQQHPAEVWLAASARMLDKAKTLKRLLEQQGIGCTIAIADLDDADFRRMQQQADELALRLLERNLPIVFNATGGNKLMTLAFWNTLSRELRGALEVQYCDTQHNSLITLFPEQRRIALGQCLSLHTYLSAYGYRVVGASSHEETWREQARQRKPLSKWLAKSLHHEPRFLGMLNGAAQDAMKSLDRGDLQGSRVAFRSDVWGLRLEALREISRPEYQLIDWQQGADALQFRSLDAARYLCGGWLEEHVWYAAHDAGAHEAACGLTIRHRDSETPDTKTDNELDVAVVHDNRLLVIECKAVAWTERGSEMQAVLHKLDNVGAHASGLMAERWLASALEVPGELRSRARAYGIHVVEGAELAGLPELLRARSGAKP